MRPELLGRGYFDFMPTSGNAFNRRLIAPAFPLPEPRWRITPMPFCCGQRRWPGR